MTKLQTFLKSDRQWPRHLRIAHANMQLRNAMMEVDQSFWHAVIEVNGTEMVKPFRPHTIEQEK